MVNISKPGLGRKRTRLAVPLALSTVCIVATCCAGCRRDAVVVLQQHSIRLSALLPLHPAWAQLQAMQALAKSEPAVQVELRFTPVVLSAPFTPPRGLPPNRVADHEKVVRDDAARYIAQLEASLAARNREFTDAERHAAEQIARTEYNSVFDKRVIELRDAAVTNARVLQKQVEQLNFKLDSLASQSRVYTAVGPNARRMLDDVKLQQSELDRRIQLKNTEIAGVLHADFKGLAQESLKSFRDKVDQEAASRIADFQHRQSRADEQEVAEAKTRVESQPTPIPPLLDHSSDISDTAGVPLTPGAAALDRKVGLPADAVFDLPMRDISRANQDQKRALQKDIDRLHTMIVVDTRKAVTQIAQREQWAMTSRSTADDWTERVAAELRSQWNTAALR